MKARGKSLGLEAAYQVLENSSTRHTALVERMYEPARLFTGPWLCKSYTAACERTRELTAEAKIPRQRLETIVQAMRDPLKQERFRHLLSAEASRPCQRRWLSGSTPSRLCKLRVHLLNRSL